MVGLDTQTDLQIFTELQEAFDEDKECEHPAHEGQPEYHAGKAEWYLQIQCPHCDHTSEVKTLCDKWVRSAETGPTLCIRCWEEGMAVFVVKERIRK